MIRRARHVVVVADSSKLDRAAFAQICPLAEIDELITDADAAPDVDPRDLRRRGRRRRRDGQEERRIASGIKSPCASSRASTMPTIRSVGRVAAVFGSRRAAW